MCSEVVKTPGDSQDPRGLFCYKAIQGEKRVSPLEDGDGGFVTFAIIA